MSKADKTSDIAFIEALAEVLRKNELTEVEVKREYGEDDVLNVRVARQLNAAPVAAAAAPVAVAAAPALAAARQKTPTRFHHRWSARCTLLLSRVRHPLSPLGIRSAKAKPC